MKNYFLIVCCLCLASCAIFRSDNAEPTVAVQRVAFYNVENLFDTLDAPVYLDEEFTPASEKNWNSERYWKKQADLTRVIAAMEFPAILGLSEVENEAVLKDLTQQTGMKERNYAIVHQESPDFRGIDVALLYNQDHFRLLKSDFIRIDFPTEIAEDYTSRDIVYAKGIFNKKDTLHVIVNHWPSRYGGRAKSEPKRTHVAAYVRKLVDSLQQKNADANILIMGDFNDDPTNKSVAEVLVAGSLVNPYADLFAAGKGSYNYRGTWNMLDQIIVSPGLQDKEGLELDNPMVLKEEWMLFEHDKNGWTPSRTYGGNNYYGGFSDHLPVFADLVYVLK